MRTGFRMDLEVLSIESFVVPSDLNFQVPFQGCCILFFWLRPQSVVTTRLKHISEQEMTMHVNCRQLGPANGSQGGTWPGFAVRPKYNWSRHRISLVTVGFDLRTNYLPCEEFGDISWRKDFRDGGHLGGLLVRQTYCRTAGVLRKSVIQSLAVLAGSLHEMVAEKRRGWPNRSRDTSEQRGGGDPGRGELIAR